MDADVNAIGKTTQCRTLHQCVRASGAAIANTLDLHFELALFDGTRYAPARRENEPDHFVGQTRDIAAVGADEVGVGLRVRGAFTAKLESPDVIADVGSGHETGLGEIDEVAIDGGAVEAFAVELFVDFGVAHR